MTDFSKYGAPVKQATSGGDFNKYGTPVSSPTVETPKEKVGKVKSFLGGASEGTGATLPLLAIDYVGRKAVDSLGSQEMKDRLATTPSLTEKYQTEFGKKDNPNTYLGGEVAGTVATLAGPIKGKLAQIPAVASKVAEKNAGKLSSTLGNIAQGSTDDIEKIKEGLKHVDTKGIKTYKDLKGAFDSKITQGSTLLDKVLDTDKTLKKTSELGLISKVGDSTITHNYVDDALTQLADHYKATNDAGNFMKINQLKEKADTTGLTIKELNDLAKTHGQEINAFNANGQAASGLAKQAAENTRTGVKTTARDLFGNKIYADTDKALSSLIRSRDLADNMVENVNKLRQKVVERGFGERVGRLVFQIADKTSLGSLGGIVRAAIPRGEGLKTMNALDLEKRLGKNLSTIQKLISENPSESDFIKSLEDILGKLPKKPQ